MPILETGFCVTGPLLIDRVTRIALCFLLSSMTFVPAIASKTSTADELSRKAVSLFAADKPEEAIDLENQAIKSAPRYWLPHCVLSMFKWKNNLFDEALVEAQEAVKLAPDNELVNLNLAQMNQLLGYYEKAIPAFRKTVKVAPESWSARIGLSQSLIANAQPADAIEVLNQMSKAESGTYNWWYNLAVSYSKLDKPKQAADAAEKAVAAATSSEQKSRANITLLIELIRANELDRARTIQNDALNSKPRDEQVYLQVLSALCKPTDTKRAKELLAQAIAVGLSSPDGYYKMGVELEKISVAPGLDPAVTAAWIELAEVAYRHATQIAPAEEKYYLALAAVFDRKGQTDEMTAMLSKAASLNSSDALPSYLVACVKAANNDLAGRLREKLVGAPENPYRLNLARDEFSVDNLHCLCKLNVLEFELNRQSGIKFAAITKKEKPIAGVLLVEQAAGTEQAFKAVEKTQSVNLSVTKSEPVLTVNEAIKFVLNLRSPGTPTNVWSFEIDSPKMPLL